MLSTTRPAASSMEDRLCQKLREMGCPLQLAPHMFHGVCASPSMRVHAFLHWFLDVVSVDQSVALQFSAAEQATLAATRLASGDDLHAKESAQDMDDDEAQLLADIARLERRHAKEVEKAHVLHSHLENLHAQTARMCPRKVYPMEPPSGLDAIDDILEHLAEGSNALELAVLSPTACISLSVHEDKILDGIQAHVMPYFQNSSPPRPLSVIAESPLQSHAVTWMLDAIAAHEENIEGNEETDDDESWSQAIDQWRAAFFSVELDWLHANLAVLDEVRGAAAEFEDEEEVEIAQWMQHTLPALLEAVADAKVSSLVVGDYPAKFFRQEHHLERLNDVLVELERQTARLQLMALVLNHEMDTMKSVQRAIYSVLHDMQRQLQDTLERAAQPRSVRPHASCSVHSPATQALDPINVAQLDSMRRQLRLEWAALGLAQERLLDQLRDVLETAPTVAAPVQQACRLKDVIETDLARAIESIYTKQQHLT